MRGGFRYAYKATYKGEPVVAGALKTIPTDDLENVRKVSVVTFDKIV